MSVGTAIAAALLAAPAGAVAAGATAALGMHWHRATSREGHRAVMTVFAGLAGAVVGAVAGAVAVAMQPADGGLGSALGAALLVLLGLCAFALVLCWLTAPPAPAGERDAAPPPPPAPASDPAPEPPADDRARRRLAEVQALPPTAPLWAFLRFAHGNEPPAVLAHARAAIAARKDLHAELAAMLSGESALGALRYVDELLPGAPPELEPGVRAALRALPATLQRAFHDPSGVHVDTGAGDVRLALAVATRFAGVGEGYGDEVRAVAAAFAAAPRVRRIARGSRYVEETIRRFAAEELLADWLRRHGG